MGWPCGGLAVPVGLEACVKGHSPRKESDGQPYKRGQNSGNSPANQKGIRVGYSDKTFSEENDILAIE